MPSEGNPGERFGAPPGIPMHEKNKLDGLPESEYRQNLLLLSDTDINCLMVCEAQRRRSFKCAWATGNQVENWRGWAETGFYMGRDGVTCAFCGNVINNADQIASGRPEDLHKELFPSCPLLQGATTYNIPYSSTGAGASVNYSTAQPLHPSYAANDNRMQTFQGFPADCPVSAQSLCDAGFYWMREADKVRCFFCGGILQGWEDQDQPWIDHAKWYPGCVFLREVQGTDFIINVRSMMTPSEIEAARQMRYNSGDLGFLSTTVEVPLPVECEAYTNYQSLVASGYSADAIAWVYRQFNFDDVPLEVLTVKLGTLDVVDSKIKKSGDCM